MERFVQLGHVVPDSLVWTKNSTNGDYSTKVGFEDFLYETFRGEKQRWRFSVWDFPGLLKSKIILLLPFCNKLLSWDNLQKKGMERPKHLFFVENKLWYCLSFLFLMFICRWGLEHNSAKRIHTSYECTNSMV